MSMKPCPLRLDTPPEVLSEWLHEHSWTTQDLLAWWDALIAAYLDAGGWDMLPQGIVVTPAGRRGRNHTARTSPLVQG
jgi:hypothetical protein